MELVENFKGHWLEPFRDKIRSVENHGDFWRVFIFSTMDELSLSGDFDTCRKLGIIELKIETPTKTEWDMVLPKISHTGEIYITLDILKTKQLTGDELMISETDLKRSVATTAK